MYLWRLLFSNIEKLFFYDEKNYIFFFSTFYHPIIIEWYQRMFLRKKSESSKFHELTLKIVFYCMFYLLFKDKRYTNLYKFIVCRNLYIYIFFYIYDAKLIATQKIMVYEYFYINIFIFYSLSVYDVY